LKVKSTSSLIKVVGLKKTSDSEHQFEVIFSKKAKSRMYSEELKFLLDDPEQNELEISVSAAIR